MKRNISRFRLPLFLALVLLLALALSSGVLADDDPAAFRVTVPSALPVVVGSDGTVTVASDAQIVNNSSFAVMVNSLTVVPQNSWQLKAWGTNYDAVQVDSKQFSMQIGGSAVMTSGYVSAYQNTLIGANSVLKLGYNAKIATQTTDLNEAIANVVFTVSWSGRGPLTDINVRTNPTITAYTEGDAFRQFGLTIAATYANGSTSTVYGWTVTDGSSLEYGQTSVTVSYTEGGITKTVEVPISVRQKAYALLYDDGELVFQRGSTPASGRTVAGSYTRFETDYYYASYNPYTVNTPWYSVSENIKKVTIKDSIAPQYTSYWFMNCKNLTTLNGMDLLDTSGTYAMNNMFTGCSSLLSVDLSAWDTSRVMNISSMFSGCSALAIADLSGWDTSSLMSMDSAFQSCSALTSVGISNWNTSNVRNMSRLFYGCESLTLLNLSRWDVSQVTNMSNMFYRCNSLSSLEVGTWDTSNVTTMKEMFCMIIGRGQLTSLDVGKWNTSKVTNMNGMFSNCVALTSLDLSGWDTSAVTDMASMFNACRSLEALNISSFETSHVTTMQAMFMNCTKLGTLDLSNFETANATNLWGMFAGCGNLVTIYTSPGFVISSGTDTGSMFYLCTSLRGGNGTTYSLYDGTYARIDRAGTPGYFTAKAANGMSTSESLAAVSVVPPLVTVGSDIEETDAPEDEGTVAESPAPEENSGDEEVQDEASDIDGEVSEENNDGVGDTEPPAEEADPPSKYS